MDPDSKLRKRLVRRLYSDRYVLITLVSFAVSISAIRFFLEITGYPQLGNAELHIAHVMWGGLMLFAGSLLPLIFVNKRILDISALLSGIGVGFFIDEVGKFITQSNNYFYPAAAPIIYVFFLLTIFIYNLVRKPIANDLRTSLFHTLEEFEEIIEGDLSELEKEKIIRRMERVENVEDESDLLIFKEMLKLYLKDPDRALIKHKPDLFERLINRWSAYEKNLFNSEKSVLLLRLLWGLAGVLLIAQPLFILRNINEQLVITGLLRSLLDSSLLTSENISPLGLLRIFLQFIGGLSLFTCAFFYKNNSKIGWAKFAQLTLLVVITLINTLIFYYDQFSTILFALFEWFVIFLTTRALKWK